MRTRYHVLSDNLTIFGSEGDGGGGERGWVAGFSWFDRGWPLIQGRVLIGLWTFVWVNMLGIESSFCVY